MVWFTINSRHTLSAASSGANTSGGNWTNFSGTTALIQVTSGSISYTGYPSSNIGNKITLTGLTGEDVQRTFTSVNSGTLFASFLIQIGDTSSLADNTSATGDYFMAFQPTNYFSRLCIRKGAQSGNIQFGVRANSAATVAWSTEIPFYLTNLIVFSYSFVTGTANDSASIWVNPSLSGVQPPPNATSISTADASSISSIAIRQAGNTPACSIDGIRLATSWSGSALPVKYNSFTAQKNNSDVILKWTTTAENNNSGFEVQRSDNGAKYYNIAIVKGAVNSNTATTYTFKDVDTKAGTYCYRLKQVDLNGAFEFSKTTCVEFEVVKNNTNEVVTTPNPFNDKLQVKYNSLSAVTVNIQILDLIGKVHHNINMQANKGETMFSLETDNLPMGIYFVRINNNGIVTTQRIVKK